jgi:CheY-like chemotaxis protein
MDVDSGCSAGQVKMSNAPRLIRILAVDDHALLRKGLAAVINAEPDMKLVAEAANGEDAIEKFRALRPDVVLMDLRVPATAPLAWSPLHHAMEREGVQQMAAPTVLLSASRGNAGTKMIFGGVALRPRLNILLNAASSRLMVPLAAPSAWRLSTYAFSRLLVTCTARRDPKNGSI